MRVKLRGKPLDVAALKLALRTLQARHRVLQARLEEVAPATSPSALSDMVCGALNKWHVVCCW